MFGVIGSGRCGFCGHTGEFVVAEKPPREPTIVRRVARPLRYRMQARAIVAAYGMPDAPFTTLIKEKSFRALAIYEPGIIGPFRRKLRKIRGYVNSYYWPDVALGDERDGVRCEDLRRLTFADASMDLVISSDIFEHVRGPMEGFAGALRVLRPGGFHIFTVPMMWPLPGTTQCASTGRAPKTCSCSRRGTTAHARPAGVSSTTTRHLGPQPERLPELEKRVPRPIHGYRNAVTFVSRKPG